MYSHLTIHLIRDVFTPTATLGRLLIDFDDGGGERIFGYTVEDADRGLSKDMPLEQIQSIKVKGKTAIPVGSYRVMCELSGKYGPDTPTLTGVPGFQYIRIHAGNDADDTEGCILPGMERNVETMTVGRSKVAVTWLRNQISKKCEDFVPVHFVISREGYSPQV